MFAIALGSCGDDGGTASPATSTALAQTTSSSSANEEAAQVVELASTAVNDFVDEYEAAWQAYDVEQLLGLYVEYGEWISETPWGRDTYFVGDGEFVPSAFENPIGGFLRWLSDLNWTMDETGQRTVIENSHGDIYVSYPARWSFDLQGDRLEIQGFTTLWLVPSDDGDGFKVVRHYNLTPQTAGEELGIPRPERPYN